MTDKEKLDAIRAEIHRLVDVRGYDRGMANDLFTFMDSLPNEPVSNDLEYAALLYYPKMSRISEPHGIIPADNKSHYLGDANEDNRKAFIVGAQWQKEQYQPTIELAENHAYFAGSENTREKLIDKACEWLKDNWRKHVWLDGDNIIHFGLWENDFRKAMEE